MRNFIETKINELSETVKDLSSLSDEELMKLYELTLSSVLNYMFSSGYTEGYEAGAESRKNS